LGKWGGLRVFLEAEEAEGAERAVSGGWRKEEIHRGGAETRRKRKKGSGKWAVSASSLRQRRRRAQRGRQAAGGGRKKFTAETRRKSVQKTQDELA
jgi:hypothetical protein